MKIDIIASGSSGNCIAITENERTILIDIGIAKTKVDKALAQVGIVPSQIVAVFITHAHGDHIKGLPFADKYKIPMYCTKGEIDKIKHFSKGREYPLEIVEAEKRVSLGGFVITPFKTHHDSMEPVGYTIKTNLHKASVCLDTGIVDNNMLEAMIGSDFYIIESNHEISMVENSSYPNSVKARIVSHIGHLSNQQATEALLKMLKGVGESIYLVHLSDKNNAPSIARMELVRELMRKGWDQGKHYKLEVIS